MKNAARRLCVYNYAGTGERIRYLFAFYPIGPACTPTPAQVHAALPMALIYRFPWACGSGLSRARFAGFFHPRLAPAWPLRPLRERRIDVAILGRQAAGRLLF